MADVEGVSPVLREPLGCQDRRLWVTAFPGGPSRGEGHREGGVGAAAYKTRQAQRMSRRCYRLRHSACDCCC